MSQPISATDQNFDELVLANKNLVFVDFSAPWCGPCKAVDPIIDELAQEYSGRVTFAKVNVDENQNTAIRYSVQSLPTILIFKDGQPFSQINGAKPKAELKKRLDAALT
ncbi:thioredoxin [Chloroflexota bacterium]